VARVNIQIPLSFDNNWNCSGSAVDIRFLKSAFFIFFYTQGCGTRYAIVHPPEAPANFVIGYYAADFIAYFIAIFFICAVIRNA
jgi:hypothetical protein